MKALVLLASTALLTSCVAPSMTIYRAGTNAKGGTVEQSKKFSFMGILTGTLIKSRTAGNVTDPQRGRPYTNSRTAAVNYAGAAKVGRAVVQPMCWGLVTARDPSQQCGRHGGRSSESLHEYSLLRELRELSRRRMPSQRSCRKNPINL